MWHKRGLILVSVPQQHFVQIHETCLVKYATLSNLHPDDYLDVMRRKLAPEVEVNIMLDGTTSNLHLIGEEQRATRIRAAGYSIR